MLGYVGPGVGFETAQSPVAFLLLLAAGALVWSAILFALIRAVVRQTRRPTR